MNKLGKNRWNILGVTFWFMLIYILAGFLWWFISLEKQNKQMYQYRYDELRRDDPYFVDKVEALQDARHRKTLQYIGEGGTFLLVIFVGAALVFRAGKRTISLSQQQQNFLMAVTHELKTPIAVIRLNLETLLKRQLEVSQQKRLLTNTLDEAARLNVLTNNILAISQLETGAYHLNFQEIDITELLGKCADAFHRRYPSRNLEVQIDQELYTNGEYQLLEMLINNLLDNARKYSPQEANIYLVAKVVDEKLDISVIDEGNGIPDSEKSNIFNKFYRVGNEDTRSSKGTGLGLYLCNRIVKDHHGRILIKDNQPQGTIFTVILPRVV